MSYHRDTLATINLTSYSMENNETRYWRLGRAMIKYRNIHRLRNGNKKGLVYREPDQDISTIRDVLPAGGVSQNISINAIMNSFFREKDL